jgi:hypothetical protein
VDRQFDIQCDQLFNATRRPTTDGSDDIMDDGIDDIDMRMQRKQEERSDAVW